VTLGIAAPIAALVALPLPAFKVTRKTSAVYE
jgi:hypothetical protein